MKRSPGTYAAPPALIPGEAGVPVIRAVTDLPARLYGGNAQEVEVRGLDYTLHLDIEKLPISTEWFPPTTGSWVALWDEVDNTYHRVEYTGTGPPGPQGPAGPVMDYATVAAASADTILAARSHVMIAGHTTAWDGGQALYRRVTSQPTHVMRFRSVDRFLPSGLEDTTNGGWWEFAEDALRPQHLGAFGGGADDTAACVAWKDALVELANIRGRIVGEITTQHTIAGSISAGNFTGNIELRGTTPGAGFTEAPGNVATGALLAFAGPTAEGTPANITAAFTAWGRLLTVSSTIALAAGTYVKVSNSAAVPAVQRDMLNRVVERDNPAGTVLLEHPIPWNITAGDVAIAGACRVIPVSLNTGRFLARDLTLIGCHAASNFGLRVIGMFRPHIENITTNHFMSAGVYCENWMGGLARNIRDYRSGNPITHASSQSLTAQRCTHTVFEGWRSDESNDMGVVFNRCNLCEFIHILANAAHGRGIYIYGSCGNRGSHMQCHRSGSTGISLVYGASYNQLSGIAATNNGHQNLWSNGVRNEYNSYHGVEARLFGITPDVFINATDVGACILGLNTDAVVSTPADTTVLKNDGTATGFTVLMAFEARLAAVETQAGVNGVKPASRRKR